MATLTLPDVRLQTIFVTEMQGQLSDGMWENSCPHDHWLPWCECDVQVGENVGRDFSAPKDKYNFANTELLEAVGERTRIKVAVVLKFGLDPIADFDLLRKLPDDLVYDTYWMHYSSELKERGITIDAIKEACENYSMDDLRKDCKRLMKAVRITK